MYTVYKNMNMIPITISFPGPITIYLQELA